MRSHRQLPQRRHAHRSVREELRLDASRAARRPYDRALTKGGARSTSKSRQHAARREQPRRVQICVRTMSRSARAMRAERRRERRSGEPGESTFRQDDHGSSPDERRARNAELLPDRPYADRRSSPRQFRARSRSRGHHTTSGFSKIQSASSTSATEFDRRRCRRRRSARRRAQSNGLELECALPVDVTARVKGRSPAVGQFLRTSSQRDQVYRARRSGRIGLAVEERTPRLRCRSA